MKAEKPAIFRKTKRIAFAPLLFGLLFSLGCLETGMNEANQTLVDNLDQLKNLNQAIVSGNENIERGIDIFDRNTKEANEVLRNLVDPLSGFVSTAEKMEEILDQVGDSKLIENIETVSEAFAQQPNLFNDLSLLAQTSQFFTEFGIKMAYITDILPREETEDLLKQYGELALQTRQVAERTEGDLKKEAARLEEELGELDEGKSRFSDMMAMSEQIVNMASHLEEYQKVLDESVSLEKRIREMMAEADTFPDKMNPLLERGEELAKVFETIRSTIEKGKEYVKFWE